MSKPLLELMLEHDVQWPDGAACAVQNVFAGLSFSPSCNVYWNDSMNDWCLSNESFIKSLCGTIVLDSLATDFKEAIITREVYEAAKAKQTPTEQILHDRGTTYGSFNDNARVSQEIKASIASGAAYDALTDRHKEALDFIAGKIARIVNGGNPDYADNWDDISGYAMLGKEDENHE